MGWVLQGSARLGSSSAEGQARLAMAWMRLRGALRVAGGSESKV